LTRRLRAANSGASPQRQVNGQGNKDAEKIKADLEEAMETFATGMNALRAERDEVLRGKLQAAEQGEREMGVEWLARKLVGRDWRSAREEKGLFSESRELPRNFPFRAISSKRVTSELHFLLERGIESKDGVEVQPPFDAVEVLIKQSDTGAEGLFLWRTAC
jgi:hypothetical protein